MIPILDSGQMRAADGAATVVIDEVCSAGRSLVTTSSSADVTAA